MISPEDIQTMEFGKSVGGYNKDDVDSFLDQLTADYEGVIKENEELKEKVGALNEKLEEYKNQERTVLQTLESAKNLMNEISASAEKRADILVKNAQLDAELVERQARDNVDRLKQEEARLTSRVADIRVRFKSMLEAELQRFDGLTEDIFGDYPSVTEKDIFGTTGTSPFSSGAAKSAVSQSQDLSKTRVNIRENE
jgi:cell division initiation protein